jgi:hypothetical protein
VLDDDEPQDQDQCSDADPVAASGIWTPAQMDTFAEHIAAHRLGGCFLLTLLGLRRE